MGRRLYDDLTDDIAFVEREGVRVMGREDLIAIQT